MTIAALVFASVVYPGAAAFLGDSIFGEIQPHLLNEETLSVGIHSGASMGNNLQLDVTERIMIYVCQIMTVTVSTLISSAVVISFPPQGRRTE